MARIDLDELTTRARRYGIHGDEALTLIVAVRWATRLPLTRYAGQGHHVCRFCNAVGGDTERIDHEPTCPTIPLTVAIAPFRDEADHA